LIEFTPKELLIELAIRGQRFDIKAFCHPKQYEFVSDPAPYATAVTSRRAGKTVGCAADLLNQAINTPNSTNLYITLTRTNAKILLWPILKRINEDQSLGGESNEADLSMSFPNRSVIYLSGVKDISEIDKFRGMALKLVYLDEAQSMRPYIEQLVDDVLDPACIDHNGKIRIIGTPGPVPVGYFHNVAQSTTWSHHFFTIWDNPFIADAKGRLEMTLARRGITVEDPSIQREFFGKWVLDMESLVIKYDKGVSHYASLPTTNQWDHVISVDLGFEDADAIAVIGFSSEAPASYLVEELVTRKQGLTELAAQLDLLVAKYKPLKLMMDEGGLGKKIAEEMRRRYGLPIVAAEKTRKFEYIELLNDALRTGRFRAKEDSLFAKDAMLLEWETDYEKQKRVISTRFHSDIIDAVLYGYRESLHYLYEPRRPRPAPGSDEWRSEEERSAFEAVQEAWTAKREEGSFWNDPFED
jgi:hypothetical protein